MRKAIAMICAFVWASLSADALQAVSQTEIRQLEPFVIMPRGAKPIAAYDRFYTAEIRNGRQMIMGVFLIGMDGSPPTAHIVAPQQMPLVLDGGCYVVNLKYDIRAAKVMSIFCNGVA